MPTYPESPVGGPPVPLETLHVGRPNVGDREVFDRLVDGIFERRWFTNAGEVVRQLERRLCEYLGVKHCIPVCNGTVGLQLACQALELSGEVVTTPYTFVATAHAIQWEGLTPVFVDVDERTHNIDPSLVEAAINERTAAIVGVHLWGRACEVEALERIAARHHVPVMYDAAHAFGCSTGGKLIGNFGACEVFSFHATKFFNTFEGGAVATNDDALAEKLRLMKNFGFRDLDTVVHLGTNGKMSEIHAAMGLACFERLPEILEVNRSNHERYRTALANVAHVHFHDYDDVERSNFQYVLLEIDNSGLPARRDRLVSGLREVGIMARRYFYPGCHRMQPYCRFPERYPGGFPIAEKLCNSVMALPTGTAVGPAEIDRVTDAIVRILGRIG